MNNESERKQQLATTTTLSNSNIGFGFDEVDPEEGRGIVGPFIKFADGEWTINGVPIDPNFRPIVIGLAHTLQRWKDNEKIDECG